ncbi:MAG: RES family NAD+ phosphorylase [Gemmatimonadota bacterium]
MRVWRLARKPFLQLDGEGTRLTGGRWNSEGVAVVYTSSTLSLATLEYLAHIDPEDIPDDLMAVTVEVPDRLPIEEVRLGDLPADWNRVFDHPRCVALGDEWIATSRSLGLRVPSALVPEEWNLLLNPAHSEAREVRIIGKRPFAFDRRLLRRGETG